jgi:hypothetical protein
LRTDGDVATATSSDAMKSASGSSSVASLVSMAKQKMTMKGMKGAYRMVLKEKRREQILCQ